MYFCDITDINQVKELKQQILPKKASREQEQLFYSMVDKWLHDFNRLPNVDEFPPGIGVDSFTQLKERLNLVKSGVHYITSLEKLQQYTGKQTDIEMAQQLNKLHRDYTFEVNVVDSDVVIEPHKRPTTAPKEIDPIPDMPIAEGAVGHLIDKINEIHGIKINEVTTKDVATLRDFPGAGLLRGFIRNGEVFVNIDNSTPDTKIHELMHLFMGGVRFENPYLYENLLNLVAKDKEVQYKMRQFSFRTEMDRAEEVLVEEMGKFLSGRKSIFQNLSRQDMYELNYHIRRLLDTMLDGDFSNKIIPDTELYSSTLESVARIVNSSEVFNNMTGTMSESFVHRVLNNYKSDLLKKGKLKEIC